jgi:hypothetical protein
MSKRNFAKLTRRLLGRFECIDHQLEEIAGSAALLRKACDEREEPRRGMPSTVRLARGLKYRRPALVLTG